jgi:cell pole-organizing protein PopZ
MSQDDIDTMLSGFTVADERPAPLRSAPEPETTEVLELTEAMQAGPAPADPAGFRTIDANSDVVFTDPVEPLRQFAAEVRPREENTGPPLLSDQATAAVTSAFGSLAHTVLVQNGQTLEDLVREMLRPLLKTWLDDNLPTIVERLVRAEIERVSRGR